MSFMNIDTKSLTKIGKLNILMYKKDIVMEVLARAPRQERNKTHKDWKEKSKTISIHR